MKEKLMALLRLARPANIITAIADIMAGFAISGSVISLFWPISTIEIINPENLFWLIFSTIGLYGGGVVFNDVFDAELDAVERPERPIPQGIVTKKEAAIWGVFLLFTGVSAAFCVNVYSGIIASAIVCMALLYDAISKHHPFVGPLNMGMCRGANLLLGISASPGFLETYFWYALIPIIYIAAITLISRGEVHGLNKKFLYTGLGLYSVVLAALFFISDSYAGGVVALPIIFIFGFIIIKPLVEAIKANAAPQSIMKAVKTGVISIILLDAAWAGIHAPFPFAILILLLLPLSRYLAKAFAVT